MSENTSSNDERSRLMKEGLAPLLFNTNAKVQQKVCNIIFPPGKLTREDREKLARHLKSHLQAMFVHLNMALLPEFEVCDDVVVFHGKRHTTDDYSTSKPTYITCTAFLPNSQQQLSADESKSQVHTTINMMKILQKTGDPAKIQRLICYGQQEDCRASFYIVEHDLPLRDMLNLQRIYEREMDILEPPLEAIKSIVKLVQQMHSQGIILRKLTPDAFLVKSDKDKHFDVVFHAIEALKQTSGKALQFTGVLNSH